MKTSFFGLEVAVRGLYTSRRQLDITGHNITNVNTPGYSRQVGIQQASTPLSIPTGAGMLGTGSDVIGISRIRDEFLDFKFWSENDDYGEWETKATLMAELEAIFDEPSDSGMNKVFDDFYSALQELSKDPSNESIRALVKQTGIAVARYFNSIANNLNKVRSDCNNAIKIKVEEVNSYARQIRDLNEQIYKAELNGNVANDLRDERTELVNKLSKIIDIEVTEVIVNNQGKEEKRFQVVAGGSFLVNHFDSYELEVYQNEEGMYDIRWTSSKNQFIPKSGEIKGYLDVRDGTGSKGEYTGVPYYINKMNEFARTFAKAFNEGIMKDGTKLYTGHAGGVGLDGTEGIRFFTYDGKSSEEFMADGYDAYDKITAFNISISADINDDPRKIAAALPNGEAGNNENIRELLNTRRDNRMFAEGAPEDFMKALVAALGIDSQYAKKLSSNQNTIINQIENRRLSVSGVSIDEEVANLVKFQHSYNAAAKMVSVMDEIYEITIHRLGVGGR